MAQYNYLQPISAPLERFEFPEEDSSYPVHAEWPHYDRWASKQIVAALMFVDDCTADNGPIEVWEGSHKEEYEHEQKSGGGFHVPEDQVDYDGGKKDTILCAGSNRIFRLRRPVLKAPTQAKFRISRLELLAFSIAPAGYLLLLDGRILHRSESNTSSSPNGYSSLGPLWSGISMLQSEAVLPGHSRGWVWSLVHRIPPRERLSTHEAYGGVRQ